MPEQERTIANLAALLADNVTGDISPQEVRDLMASAMGGYAGLIQTVAGGTETLVGVGATPVLIDVYDAVSSQSIDVNLVGAEASLANSQLTVGVDGFYQLSFFASFNLGSNNKTAKFIAFLNALATDLEYDVFVSNGSDLGGVGLSHVFELNAADLLDFRVSIDTPTADVIFSTCGLSMHRVG